MNNYDVPASTATQSNNVRPQVIGWGDHDFNDPLDDYDFDDFDMDHFPSSQGLVSQSNHTSTSSNQGINPNEFFQKAFDEPNSEIVDLDFNNNDGSDFWLEIPQLNIEDKTGPKIGTNLSKAVNAALSVKSNKDCILDLSKKYLRPENCDLMVVPKVNKEIWDVIPRQAHSSDVFLQEIQKSLISGLVPVVEMAENIAKNKESDSSKTKTLIGDCLSLIGHAFFNISMKRRFNIRNNLNPRYQKICNGDIPVTSNLFGDNVMARVKELGDPTKIPLGIRNNRFGNRGKFGLNFKGPAVGYEQQQGHAGSFPRGRGYPKFNRGRGRRHPRRQNFQ